MSLFVKLCGIRTRADLEAAIAAGADAVGFVLTESPRQVALDQAAHLVALLPPHVLGVAVFHHPTEQLLQRALDEVSPDLFQAEPHHLDVVPPERRLPVVAGASDIADAVAGALATTTQGMVLVDSSARGGTGHPLDWAALSGFPGHDSILLAGGLDSHNVAAAVRMVKPLGVDVSSGIERRPGEKDPDLMRSFVQAARKAQLAQGVS